MNYTVKTIITLIWLLLVKIVFSQDSLNNALLDASWENDINKVKELVYKGADVNTKTYDNTSPLHFACANNNMEMVKIFIFKGAELDAFDYNKKTALILCAELGLDSIGEFLILNGADINKKNKKGKDALYTSTENGYYLFSDLLMYYGADVQAKAKDSSGLVHAAIKSDNLELLELILSNNVNPNLENTLGKTPMYYAFIKDDTLAVKILKKFGGKFNNKEENKKDFIKLAIQYSRLNMINFLLQDSSLLEDKDMSIIYDEAIRNDHKEIIEILEKMGIKRSWKPILQGIKFEANTFINFKDHSSGFSIGSREMKTNIFLNAGYTHRLWPKRVLIQYNNTEMLQLWERRGNVYFSLSKSFRLVHRKGRSLMLEAGIMEYYTWGRYDGMNLDPYQGWRMSPVISVLFIDNYFSLSIQYANLDFSNNLPKAYILIKCGWTIPFSR